MSTEYKDENGNSPEVGGLILSPESSEKARILEVSPNVLLISQWYLDEELEGPASLVFDTQKATKEGYHFYPKPERKIPGDKTPVWILSNGVKIGVRISSGKMISGNLMCYCDGDMRIKRGDDLFPQEEWEVIS